MHAEIVVLPGDGIGPEVAAAAVAVLKAVAERFNHTFTFSEHDIGGVAIDRHGEPLPASTLTACQAANAVLLGAVGGKMIWEALKPEDEAEEETAATKAASRGLVALVATAVGTSIDAGAVGVGLALLGENIWLIAACIGATTFALATLGLLIGKAAGTRLGKIVELVGGVALIALGLKILLEHLGVLKF